MKGITCLGIALHHNYPMDESIIRVELENWRNEMRKEPSLLGSFSKNIQDRINRAIPEKIHTAITAAIREMTRALLFGSELTAAPPLLTADLSQREHFVHDTIRKYSRTASAEGAISGAGGFLLGLADFPIWLGIKIKMLCEIARLYGIDLNSVKERIYILHIFQLTFSGRKHRKEIFAIMEDWNRYSQSLPPSIQEFEWQKFQTEYRDFIDVAKLLQLVPGIGAPVGAVVNLHYTRKLGNNAMNAYRLRLLGHQ